MAYGGKKKKMHAAAEIGRNPVIKHRIQPEYGDEHADAGRDGRTRLAKPNFQARTGTGGKCCLPLLCYTVRYVITTHTYIHIDLSLKNFDNFTCFIEVSSRSFFS